MKILPILTALICISANCMAQETAPSLSQLVEMSKFKIPAGKTLSVVGAYSTKSNINNVELDEACNHVEIDIAAEPDQRFYIQYQNIDAPWTNNGGAGTRYHTTRAYYYDGTTLENFTMFLNSTTFAPLHGTSVILSNYPGTRKGLYLPITTGQGFLTSFLLGSDDGEIGKLIEKGVKPTVTWKKVGSAVTVTITDSSSGGQNSEDRKTELTLDSSQNFSLTKASIVTNLILGGKKHQNTTEISVSDYAQVGGQYYPKKASFVATIDGKQLTDTEWQLASVQFIDAFPNDPGLPPYSTVRDKRTGIQFSTGDKTSIVKQQIENYVK